MSGRSRDGRLVHFAPGRCRAIRPGDVVTTTVTGAAPHHLIADAGLLAHRRTRAGDAHAEGRRGPAPASASASRASAPRPSAAAVGRVRPMSAAGDPGNAGFEQFKGDIEDVERRMAREFEPGSRALVVAVLVFVVLLSLILAAHRRRQGLRRAGGRGRRGQRRGVAAVAGVHVAGAGVLGRLLDAGAADPPVGTRVGRPGGFGGRLPDRDARGVVAADRGRAVPGPGIGLVIGWIAVIVLTFHWARVVWSRTAVQLAAEEERRRRGRRGSAEGAARRLRRRTGRSRPAS